MNQNSMTKCIGDSCEKCHDTKLIYVAEHYPHTSSHFSCPKCDSTYGVGCKIMYTEDSQTITCRMVDELSAYLSERGYDFDGKGLDDIHEMILEKIENRFGIQQYKHQMG